MKTTENISLAGYAFTIESDAYEVLAEYLNAIKKGFEGNPSAEEIVADIEERIAELLSEKYKNGMTVSLRMVNDTMIRIGDPSELAQDNVREVKSEPKDASPKQKENLRNRRLYRSIEERVFGGVCAGLGRYFNIDKVLFRIIFLALFLIGFFAIDEGPFFGFSIIAYICLWIAMPAARTGDQKREMTGRPTDLDGYRSKDFDISKESNEVKESSGLRFIGRAFCIIIGLILIITGISGLLGCIMIPAIPSIMEAVNMELNDLGPLAETITGARFWGMVLVIAILGFIGMLYGGIMMTFDLKAPAWKPGLIIFIAWIISILGFLAYFIIELSKSIPMLMV